ncbi:hypothetical protein GW916_07685 [bacterium]|nr:hypothetical protein [bacterium]
MKSIIKVLTLALSLVSLSSLAAGPFGLGAVIGQPSGLSARYSLGGNNAIDASLGWSLSSNGYVAISADYLWEKPNFFRIDSANFDLHYGAGAGIVTADGFTGIGFRAPVGVSYYFKKPAIQVFFELAAFVALVPDSDFWIHGALGGRYYF